MKCIKFISLFVVLTFSISAFGAECRHLTLSQDAVLAERFPEALNGKVQSYIWNLRRNGKVDEAADLQVLLRRSLEEDLPLKVEVLRSDRVNRATEVAIFHFRHWKAVFKPDPEFWVYADGHGSFASDKYAEVAAFEISEMLGLDLVPLTVFREFKGSHGSLQVFVPEDKVRPSDLSLNEMYLFDFLINNLDRHRGNWLQSEGRVVAIDHGLAFKPLNFYPQPNPPLSFNEIEVLSGHRDLLAALESDQFEARVVAILENKVSRIVLQEILLRRKILIEHLRKQLGLAKAG